MFCFSSHILGCSCQILGDPPHTDPPQPFIGQSYKKLSSWIQAAGSCQFCQALAASVELYNVEILYFWLLAVFITFSDVAALSSDTLDTFFISPNLITIPLKSASTSWSRDSQKLLQPHMELGWPPPSPAVFRGWQMQKSRLIDQGTPLPPPICQSHVPAVQIEPLQAPEGHGWKITHRWQLLVPVQGSPDTSPANKVLAVIWFCWELTLWCMCLPE